MGFMDLLKKGASAAHGTLLEMKETKEKFRSYSDSKLQSMRPDRLSSMERSVWRSEMQARGLRPN